MEYREATEAEKEYDEKLQDEFIEILKRKVRRLGHDELKAKVSEFLEEHRLCTLATCSGGVPRSTPVRYRSRGLTIYILTEGGGKVKNIRENPKVSVSLYGEYSGFQSVRGLQIWGEAEIIELEDRERYLEAKGIINLEEREDLKRAGVRDVRPDMRIIKVETRRARFLSFPEGILNQVLTVGSD